MNLRRYVLAPSFYGLATFTIAFVAYLLNLVGYYDPTPELWLACGVTVGAFATSLALHAPRFGALEMRGRAGLREVPPWAILLLHLVGLLGIALYVRELVAYFGSLAALGVKLATSSHEVRWASEEIATAGTQASYFGWLAIWLSAARGFKGKWGILWWMGLAQLAANLVYIDRTRPIWILFTAMVVFLGTRPDLLDARRFARFAGTAFLLAATLFLGVGAWVGKVEVVAGVSGADVAVPIFLEPLYAYATNGFAYFDQVLQHPPPGAGPPERSLYPLYTLLHRAELVDAPPSLVNDYLYVPMATNVGTFLEPFYRDGGVPMLLLGIVIHSFAFDRLALALLARGSALTLCAWATLCFVNLIGFFTPKFNNFPTWMFVGLGLAVLLFSRAPTAPASSAVPGSAR